MLTPHPCPRILRSMLQHVKHLYGIRMDVRGLEHFDLKEPYVVVSNHQSSLDLLGTLGVGVQLGQEQGEQDGRGRNEAWGASIRGPWVVGHWLPWAGPPNSGQV